MTESAKPPLALTPKKKFSHRIGCLDCACQQFQSDDAVISAFNSDSRMEALNDWLSGAQVKNHDGNISSMDKTKPCPNRLQASIAIVNAIRDACRPYLESSPPSISSSPPPSNSKNVQPTLNENANYEDAFPSLSCIPSTSAPTMLVGRKKSKGSKKNSSSLSSASATVAPTMLVGRKKSKGPKIKNNKQSSKGGSHATKNSEKNTAQSHTESMKNSTTINPSNNAGRETNFSKAKKKIKPVTISLSASTSLGVTSPPLSNHTKPLKFEGSIISSLPSQDASEMSQNKAENIPIIVKSSEMSNGCTATKIREVNDAVPKIQIESTGETWSNLPQTPKNDGSVSSLPSQNTPTVLVSATVQIPPKNFENKPTIMTSSERSTGCSVAAEEKTVTHISSKKMEKLKRLVMVYSTILRTHLAPFLLLELHLLVRLISLSDKGNPSKRADANTIWPFSDVFQSEQQCRNFAAETLSCLEPVIVNMGHETIKTFVTLPALQSYCPRLCMSLQDTTLAGNSALIFETDQKALGSNTNTPHLTLPFDHARDSRHNYRSVDLNRLYKEREELRDSFLYQLRAFQDIRGRLMEHAQAEKHIACVRHQSREMLKNLSAGNNTLWFVNFFCDLLLQIGLVPVSETDSEVLKQIGDKKRLQKLHMRFTSKSGQTNKSSRKLRIDQKGPSSNTNTALPEQSFSGHQEFFSIFLRAGDSYKFNVHLKRRLAQIITEMMAVNDTKGLCEHISKTQMLAKFLGMLVFSPNWNLSSTSVDLTAENININLPPINIKECIEVAWKRSRLVVVIPWVVQFLGMMKWDAVSRKCQYYIDTFSLLWSINHYCLPYQIDHHSFYQTNMITTSFLLDTLFHEVVGLAPAQNLPILAFPTRMHDDSTEPSNLVPFDDLPLWFSKPFLFPSIPYMRDLCELLKDLAQNHGKTAVTASAKKVRPDTVRKLGDIDSSQKLVSRIPFSGDNISPWASKRPATPKNKGGIKEMLVDSFFHQHKDLQQLCEMIVDRAMKNFSESVSPSCIQPIFRNGATSFDEYLNRKPIMTLEEYMNLLKALEADANKKATAMMNDDFGQIIKGTLQLLAPKETKSKVVEVASSLAIHHALLNGRSTISLMISGEKKKLLDEFARKKNKFLAGVPIKKNVPRRESAEPTDMKIQCIVDLTESLRAFHQSNDSLHSRLDRVKQEKADVIHHLQHYFIGAGSAQSILELELQIISMLKEFFSNPPNKSVSLLQPIIEVFDVLSLLGSLGYAGSNQEDLESLICDTSNMFELMNQVKHSNKMAHPGESISHETMGNFLFAVVEGSLISHRALENALLHSVKTDEAAKNVSRIMLQRLASTRTGMGCATGGPLVMVRLQRLLTRDQPK